MVSAECAPCWRPVGFRCQSVRRWRPRIRVPWVRLLRTGMDCMIWRGTFGNLVCALWEWRVKRPARPRLDRFPASDYAHSRPAGRQLDVRRERLLRVGPVLLGPGIKDHPLGRVPLRPQVGKKWVRKESPQSRRADCRTSWTTPSAPWDACCQSRRRCAVRQALGLIPVSLRKTR